MRLGYIVIYGCFRLYNIFNYIFKMTSFKYIYRYDLELYIDVTDDVLEKEILLTKERI